MPAKKRQAGKGISDVINFVRNQKLISRGLGMIPHPGAQLASQIAAQLGVGHKKKRKRRRAQGGRGIFSDLGGGIGNVFGGLGGGIGSVARGLFGGKKRPARRVVKYT